MNILIGYKNTVKNISKIHLKDTLTASKNTSYGCV